MELIPNVLSGPLVIFWTMSAYGYSRATTTASSEVATSNGVSLHSPASAGLGQSLPMVNRSAVTVDAVAANLHALLAAAAIPPPYLVGHSLGVQIFARTSDLVALCFE